MSEKDAGRDAAAREHMLEALRAWGSLFGDWGRQFGVHTGMHGTDASALMHIITAEERGEPLTQSALSRKIGLTTGATSSLLNRLEAAGHVERRRDSSDRRVVTLWSKPAVHEEVDSFFADVGVQLNRVVSAHDGRELERFAALRDEMTGTLETQLELRLARPRASLDG